MYTISQLNICEQLLIFFAIRQLPIICHSNFRDLTTLIRIDSWNWIYEIFIILFIWAVAPAKSSIKWLIIFYALYVFLKTHKKVVLVTNSMPTPLKRQISGTAVIYSYMIMFLHTPLHQGNLSKRNNFDYSLVIWKSFQYYFTPLFFLHVIRL